MSVLSHIRIYHLKYLEIHPLFHNYALILVYSCVTSLIFLCIKEHNVLFRHKTFVVYFVKGYLTVLIYSRLSLHLLIVYIVRHII